MILPGLVVLGMVVVLSHGYGTGAPKSACDSMFPGHSVNASTSASPYQITISNTTYYQNGEIEVTVTGDFKGILMQARRKDSTNADPVGTFSTPPTNTKLTTCTATSDSWTHANTDTKNGATIKWKSPQYTAGDIEFIATIAQEKVTFWTEQKSGTVSPETDYPAGSAMINSYGCLTVLLLVGCSLFLGVQK